MSTNSTEPSLFHGTFGVDKQSPTELEHITDVTGQSPAEDTHSVRQDGGDCGGYRHSLTLIVLKKTSGYFVCILKRK